MKIRRDLVVEIVDEAGSEAMRYRLFRCWVSAFQGLPDRDANANAVAIELITIENDRWEKG
jgi:phage tail-like protein